MNTLARNLRIILLENQVKPDEWQKCLASFFNGDENSAELLLSGQIVEDYQGLRNFERAFKYEISHLMLVELSEQLDSKVILKLNLTYLLGTLPHGKKKQLANHAGVDQTTISKWLKRKQAPNSINLKKIIDYFALPEGTDLRSDCLFLSSIPIGEFETRRWIHLQIDNLDSNTLRQLMPALKKLFE